ncbi:uncharacterized protein JCM6883_005496 [Sporobolomyces salmoneus]|uniref:uncharacterized protein n=1 Tax=Sporobolomyces salmoneus TaxID=183962 RepID=UPI00317F2DF6
MILIPSALHSFLSQLTSSTGIPHTAILTSSPLSSLSSGGSIISYHSLPASDIVEPFPKPYLPGLESTESGEEEDEAEEEVRVGMYAALAVGTWGEQRGQGEDRREPLTLETEVGRMMVMEIGATKGGRGGGRFLLILVGSEIRTAEEYLREPLSKISN